MGMTNRLSSWRHTAAACIHAQPVCANELHEKPRRGDMLLANQTNPNQSPSGATQKSVRKWEVYTSLPHHRMDHPPPFDGWFAPNKQTTHMSLLRSSAAACAFSPIHMSPLRGLRVIVAPPYMHIPIHIGGI